MSGFKAFSANSAAFGGTYKKQSESVYHQEYAPHALIKIRGTWNLVDKDTIDSAQVSWYFEAVSSSACPNGASYRDTKGNSADMKVGTCDSSGFGSGGESSMGGAIGGVVVCLLIAACVAACCWRRFRPGQGAASSPAVPAVVQTAPAAKQISCPHCKAVLQVTVHGEQACGSCGNTFTVPPTLLGAQSADAKQHIDV